MESDAQQYLELIKAGADIESKTGWLKKAFSSVFSRKSGQPVDFHQAALQALRENAIETFATLELTVDEALRILGPNFALEDLNAVNTTWEKRWAECASRVGLDDSERRTWWARLLAGEIEQPGTYSFRTLAVMDTLSTTEAQLFTRLCAYVWMLPMTGMPGRALESVPTLIMPPEVSQSWKPNTTESRLLEDAGLARDNSLTYSIRDITAAKLRFQGHELVLQSGTPNSLRLGQLTLTSTGAEIYNLVTPERSEVYLDEILAEWRQNSWNVVECRR